MEFLMVRSVWKGDISFGLVSIPISLVPTESNNEIHFHLINSKTNARIRYQRVDEETGKEVPWSNIAKGYEYDKDSFIIVDEKNFEKASPELFKIIDIEEFVDSHEIDILYYSKPYYVLPEGKNKKAYLLFHKALAKTKKVGVAKIILRTKEYLSLILAHHETLVLYLIHFNDEIKSENEVNLSKDEVKKYKISDKEIKMAVDLINDMSNPWQPEKYHNEYRETLQKWLDKQTKSLIKQGKKVTKSMPGHDAVVDFVALLKESMKKKNAQVKDVPRSKKITKKIAK
jgi:DNA end-binding protein Ku